MANKYGEAALIAARMDTHGKALSPAARWEHATAKLYPQALPHSEREAPDSHFSASVKQV